MQKAWIILGTNVGEKLQNLKNALKLITSTNIKISQMSSIYESTSWGYIDENYYNQVVEIETDLPPEDLLNLLLKIEKKMGRKRTGLKFYESRIIDLDILFYENVIIESESLIIPHPRICERKFVLLPLNELMPSYIHPILKLKISKLLEITGDTLKVEKVK
jgi:deoxyguanosine kinase